MNKKFILISIIFIFGFTMISACTKQSASSSYTPPLNIVGDVSEPFTLRSLEDDFDMIDIETKDGSVKGIKFEDILEKVSPLSDNSDIFLVGIDGMMAKIEDMTLEGSFISFSDANGWEAIHYNHPPSSNVKHLKEIIIVSTDEDRLDIGMNIINSEKNIRNITPGELYANSATLLTYFEGESSVEKEGVHYNTSVYTQRRIFKLEDMVEESLQNALVMNALGDIKSIEANSYFEANSNTIDYVSASGKERLKDVKGVILDPPEGSIQDSYYDIGKYVKEDEDVLFIVLDGFGYHQYKHAIENNHIPFLTSQPEATKALSVYRPVTNAGLAAIITGKSPAENGVYSRKQRQLQVDSIFKYVQDLGKEAIYIEGNIGILDTEIQPVLNVDDDGDGYTDDEVQESTLNVLDKGYNLVFTHFHGIDDSGHSNGDFASQTMDVLSYMDTYLEELVSKWHGKVIITADHGMHSTKDAGDHGQFRYENMIVPFIVMEGGQ